MRWSRSLSALAILGISGPALAEQGTDVPGVTVLRGTSAPPVVSTPPVQTVVYPEIVPEIVYVPTYYPAYGFYPGYVIQSRRFMHQPVSVPGLPHLHR